MRCFLAPLLACLLVCSAAAPAIASDAQHGPRSAEPASEPRERDAADPSGGLWRDVVDGMRLLVYLLVD